MNKVSVFLIVAVLLLGGTTAQAVITNITFEEGLGLNGTAINTQYTGVTFQGASSGIPWVYGDATTGGYNVSSWPSGQQWGGAWYWINDQVFAWTTSQGNDGKIAFDSADASFVQLNYCSAYPFYLEAYDSSNNLIDSDSGPANRRFLEGNELGPGTLRVDAPVGDSIAYVMVHDQGNFWCIDNVSTDASDIGVIPEPASLIIWSLLAGAALTIGWWRRKRA